MCCPRVRVTSGSLVAALVVCGLAAFVGGARGQAPWPHPDLQQFFLITGADDDLADGALDEIAAAWRDGYAGMVWASCGSCGRHSHESRGRRAWATLPTASATPLAVASSPNTPHSALARRARARLDRHRRSRCK